MSDKQTTADICVELRATKITLLNRAADEIERLRGLLWEVMSAPEAAYHGDWFARATEALPSKEDQDG